MTDEKNLVEVTIRVDMSGGITLEHVCARCGATAKSVPIIYDSIDRGTGRAEGQVFTARSAKPPDGWEHIRIQYAEGEGTKHVEVCPECLRAFFRFAQPDVPMETPEETRRFAVNTYNWIADKVHALDPDNLKEEVAARLYEVFRGYIRHGHFARVAELDPKPWADKEDEWASEIFAAFPTRSGSHAEYAMAMEMVGNRHSKGALVALVNWLLVRIAKLEARLRVIPCLVRDIDKTRDRDEVIAIARGEEPPPTDRQLALRGLNPDER